MKSSTAFKSLWAKKSDRNGRLEWLSLEQHLYDTKMIAGLLWEHWLSRGQRNFIIQSLQASSDSEGKKLFQLIANLHDLGKATPVFQISKGYVQSDDLHFSLIEKLVFAGFTDIDKLQLSSPRSSHHALAGQSLLTWYGVDEDFTSIVGAHHGKPIDHSTMCEIQKSYERNYYQEENPDHPVYQKWDQVQREIFKWALYSNGFNGIEEFPAIPQASQVILSGLTIMADWIASNEHYFPLMPIEQSEAFNQEERFVHGWEKWYKAHIWEPTNYCGSETIYQSRFKFDPRQVQRVFYQVIESAVKPGIFILEAPMGIGKTEAALVAAEQLAFLTDRSGLFFGLPTQATSDGIFPRIKDWLDSISSESKDPMSLRLVHGKSALNDTFAQLANQIDSDGKSSGSIVVNQWFSGRKTSSLDDFVVGTVDQFLLTALKQKHLALRHLGFSKKVVVIDEVHAYDAYMNQYLERAIQWMGTYGVPVIILSATLPADRRERLVKAYMSGMGLKWSACDKPATGLKTLSYPLITYNDGHQIKQETYFEKDDSKTVKVVREDSDNLNDLISRLIKNDGIIGIIVNTVNRAQKIAEACADQFGNDAVELLHSRFIAMDRIEKEKNLMSMIGKNANRPRRKIIVGTQVMEQSLDIDFDVLISELAPMDLLIQRIGRLHRHDITRPNAHQQPVIYVIGTNEQYEYESGSISVYGDYLLTRTQAFLPKTITLPEDISPLVQKVYSEEVFSSTPELIERYEKSHEKYKSLIETKEKNAKKFQISAPVLKKRRNRCNTLAGWLSNAHPNQTEEYTYAQVRDTQETLEVIALKKIEDGYGFFGTNDDISKKIEDFSIAKEIAKHTLRLPNILSASYHIDKTVRELEKYNLKKLAHWQNQIWLKGSLGIIFDEHHQFVLNGYVLTYDTKYGLIYERMGDIE